MYIYDKDAKIVFFVLVAGVMQNPYLGILVVSLTFSVKLWIRQTVVEIREARKIVT